MSKLKGTIQKMEPTDICRTVHPTATEYTFVSLMHRAFPRLDLVLCPTSSLTKLRNIEVKPYIFSDYKTIEPEINEKKNRILINTWKLNNTQLKNQ